MNFTVPPYPARPYWENGRAMTDEEIDGKCKEWALGVELVRQLVKPCAHANAKVRKRWKDNEDGVVLEAIRVIQSLG